MIFVSNPTLCNTSSFLTRSAQLISIHLQQLISKLLKHFLTTSRTVQFSATHKAVLQVRHFTGFFLQFKFNLLLKKSSSCWKLLLPWQSWI
jgi:hypothetical protein